LLATVAILTITLTATIILADTPVKQVSLQGRLSDPTGKPLDGSFSVKFEIFASETEGTPGTGLWSEAQKVTVTKGLFGVNLGSVNGIPLAFDKPYWVEVSIGAEKLSPRYPLTSAPYSFYGGVAGSIDASKIIGTLNINQIPALTAAQIPNLDAAKIISGTLASARIPALTADKITSVNPSAIVGTIPDSKIGSVNLIKVYYNTVDSNGQTVANHGIPADSVNGKLSTLNIPSLPSNWAGTIDASRITGLTANMIPTLTSAWTGTIDASRITGLTANMIPTLTSAWTGTVDVSKISGTGTLAAALLPTITGAKIANDAITGNKILDKTIENGDIADGAINTYKILDGGIRHQDIAPSEITKDLIDRGAVTVEKLDKAYLAGQSQYVVKTGPGVDQRTKIASDLLFTYGIFTASCTCSVPDDGTHKVYFCNCWVANDAGTINAYANVFQSNGYAQTNTAIDWIIVER